MYGALSQCVEQALIVGFSRERDQLRCAITNFSPTEGLDRQEDNHSSKLGSSVSVWEVKTRVSAGLFVGDYRCIRTCFRSKLWRLDQSRWARPLEDMKGGLTLAPVARVNLLKFVQS
jgi:hypothetical protein